MIFGPRHCVILKSMNAAISTTNIEYQETSISFALTNIDDFRRISHNPLPSKLGDELTLAGYRVFEALAISEVLYLQEHENINVVVIDSSVKAAEEKARQLRGIIVTLQARATSADVQWGLSLLFPSSVPSLQ